MDGFSDLTTIESIHNLTGNVHKKYVTILIFVYMSDMYLCRAVEKVG